MENSEWPSLTRSGSKLGNVNGGPLDNNVTIWPTDTNSAPQDDLHVPRHSIFRNPSPTRPRTDNGPHEKKAPGSQSLSRRKEGIFQPPLSIFNPSLTDVRYNGPSEELLIGMALGSPSQANAPPMRYRSTDTGTSYTTIPPRSTVNSPEEGPLVRDVEDVTKQKGNRWKMFGGIFAKKSASTPNSPGSPFYQLQHSPLDSLQPEIKALRHKNQEKHATDVSKSRQLQTSPQYGQVLSPKRHHLQKRALRDDKIRIKPSRAQTLPSLNVREPAPSPPPKDARDQRPCLPSKSTVPMLQVEIPSIEMERYSVMFNNVLEPSQAPLLLRRQAQLGKLRSAVEPERPILTGTSPQPIQPAKSSPVARSSSFSLFPPLPSPRRSVTPKLPYRPTPLQRSATAPTGNSPSRANFENAHKEQDKIILMVHSPSQSTLTSSSHAPKWGNRGSYPSPTSTDTNYRDDFASAVHAISKSISKTPSKAEKPRVWLTDISEKALPCQPDLIEKHRKVSLPTSSSSPHVSIAQSISLSRRQRQLLVPIVPKSVKQPMHPTLVDVRESEGNSARKSHHGLLEEA